MLSCLQASFVHPCLLGSLTIFGPIVLLACVGPDPFPSSDEGSLTEVGGGYTFFWKGRPPGSPRIQGVGFAVRSSLLPSFTESPVGISERLMSMRIPLTRGRFATLLSVYAPTLDSSDEEKTLSTLHCFPHSSMYLVLISCFHSAISMHGLALITKCGRLLSATWCR